MKSRETNTKKAPARAGKTPVATKTGPAAAPATETAGATRAVAADELDPAKRIALLSEAERYTMDVAAPVMPIWHYDQYYMYKPPVTPEPCHYPYAT